VSPPGPGATWKQVVVLVATVLAFAVSLSMMQQLVGLSSPWMVVMAFFCFLGLAKVADPIYALKVPHGLHALRPWEVRGDVYRRLGVPGFGALLRNTPLRILNTTVYVSHGRRDLQLIRRQVESAEASHFWAAILVVPYLASCVWMRKWSVLAGLIALQVVMSAYPIMHLRSVRARLDRSRR
jgi:hypothetical protein